MFRLPVPQLGDMAITAVVEEVPLIESTSAAAERQEDPQSSDIDIDLGYQNQYMEDSQVLDTNMPELVQVHKLGLIHNLVTIHVENSYLLIKTSLFSGHSRNKKSRGNRIVHLRK